MSTVATDEMIQEYIHSLSDVSRKRFLELSKMMNLPGDSLEVLVKNYLRFYNGKPTTLDIIDISPLEYRDLDCSTLVRKVEDVDEHGVWEFAGQQDSEEVESTIRESGIDFPSSLVEYFNQVGSMSCGDRHLPNITKRFGGRLNTLLMQTEHLKEYYDLPEKLFCIDCDSQSDYVDCVDLRFRQHGGCPVVTYDKEQRMIIGIVAVNFDIWFRWRISKIIESLTCSCE